MDKKNKLVLFKKEDKNTILSDEENVIKNELIKIEKRLESINKIVTSINEEDPNTIFDYDNFLMLASSVAIKSAVDVVTDYFDK